MGVVNKAPKVVKKASPDLTSVNSGPASIDEDGEPVEADRAALSDKDVSPRIQAMSVSVANAGKEMTHISVTVHTPSGIRMRHMTVGGAVTANRLASLLQSISGW